MTTTTNSNLESLRLVRDDIVTWVASKGWSVRLDRSTFSDAPDDLFISPDNSEDHGVLLLSAFPPFNSAGEWILDFSNLNGSESTILTEGSDGWLIRVPTANGKHGDDRVSVPLTEERFMSEASRLFGHS